MSYRTAAICAILSCLVGCNRQESFIPVQHRSGWERAAGESELAAVNIARQSSSNSANLIKAMRSGKDSDVTVMTGKLVAVEGKIDQRDDSSWTLKNDAGWTIVAQFSDRSPPQAMSHYRSDSCCAQGMIQKVDSQQKRIVLADAELAPEAMSDAVVSK